MVTVIPCDNAVNDADRTSSSFILDQLVFDPACIERQHTACIGDRRRQPDGHHRLAAGRLAGDQLSSHR